MIHIFRNIFFAVIALSITHSSCFSMEENDKLLRRNVSSAKDLSENGKQIANPATNESMQVAPECCCVHVLLDCFFNYWGYYAHKNES